METDSETTDFGVDMLRHFCVINAFKKIAEKVTIFCAKITPVIQKCPDLTNRLFKASSEPRVLFLIHIYNDLSSIN